MYTSFFNLKTKPFELVPNPEFLYLSKTHRKAIIYLEHGIKEKAGFILLTGEIGSGKTTLIKNLTKKLNGKVTISKVFNTKVNSEQLISMVNDDFGLDIKGKDKVTLLRELYDFLIERYASGYHAILIIDEAQNLSPELLEEVRMLSNLETEKAKLLQIILVGQPELRKSLAAPELQQLRQRISISCHIYPLTRQETEEYILHRLEVAGNRNAVKFFPETMDIIHHYSRGIPRLMNIICDFLMLSAFVEETREITTDTVKDIVGELELENQFWGSGHAASQTSAPEASPALPSYPELQDMGKRVDQIETSMKMYREEMLSTLQELKHTIGNDQDASRIGRKSMASRSHQFKRRLLGRLFGYS